MCSHPANAGTSAIKAKEMRLGLLMQALVKRDLWQRVEDVDGINRRLGGADELGDGQWGLLSVGVETRDGSLFAATGRGFLESLLDRFTGFASALLNAAQQLVVLAFGELEIVVRELGPLLFQLALGDVPVALDFE